MSVRFSCDECVTVGLGGVDEVEIESVHGLEESQTVLSCRRILLVGVGDRCD